MASYQIRQRDPLLDSTMQAVLERRGKELLGVVLVGLGVLVALVLWSYRPDDPGWMSATDAPAQNLLGRFGASMASPLIIIAGYGAWGVALALLAWGLRLVSHKGEDEAISRVIFAPIGIALTSVYASTLVPGIEWTHSFGFGGLFGDTILGAILGVAPVQATVGLKVMSVLFGIGVLGMGLFVLGFNRAELAAIVRFLIVGLVVSYTGILTLLGRSAQGAANAAVLLREHYRDRRLAAGDARAYAAEQAQLFPVAVAAPKLPLQARILQAVANRLQSTADAAPGGPNWQPALQPRRMPPPGGTGETRIAAALRVNSLRAEPRPMPPEYVAAPPKTGLLARMPALVRRTVEPAAPLENELIEPTLARAAYDALAPTDARIKAKISDVIAARQRSELAPADPPVTSAAQRRPQPLIADPARRGFYAEAPASAAALGVGALRPGATAARAGALMQPPLTRALIPPSTAPVLPTLRASQDYSDIGHGAPRLDPIFEDTMPDVPSAAFAHAPIPLRDFPPLTAEPRKMVQHGTRKANTSRQAQAEAQPRLKFEEPAVSTYELPPLSLLTNPVEIKRGHLSDEALEENARMLESVLDDYGVKGEIVSVRPGPVVTMYELEPAPGLKASRVIGLADDIARSMSALSARVSTVPGRTVIGIELPNVFREKVVLREILSARDFGDSTMRLPLALGKDIAGEPVIANLAKMPHLLIAGTTGSGKSVAINTMILSLLYKLSPEECRLIMIDPKMLELSVYDGIPHLLSPVVTDPKKAVVALKWVVGEMEERYRKMSKMGVRNIEGYNGRVREALDKGELFKRTIQTGFDEDTGEPVFEVDEFQPIAIPYIVVVVDEMADLMMVAGKEIEACIQRLAQMARASGIHLIMATQRPSVDVITGTIKANFPTRISFQVTSKIDSRTILGEQGAEQLLGMGDMLYMAGGAKITRIHGPFVSDEEVEEIVTHLKSYGPPVYMSGVVEGVEDENAADIDAVLGLGSDGLDDTLYDQAVAIVARDRKCSTSYIQRKLGIGYNKAAKLVEQMEEHSVVTPANHVGKREILVEER